MPDIAWWAWEDEEERERRPQATPAPTPVPAPTPTPPQPQPMAPQLPAWMQSFLGAPQQPQPYQRPTLPMPPAQGPEALPAWAQSLMGALSPRNVTEPVEGMAALLSDIVTGRTSPMQFGQQLTQEAGGGNVLDEIAAMWRMGQQRQQQMPVTMQDVADASRRYVAEPLQAALIQQNPLTRAAEALGLRKAESTQEYNPLSLLFPTIGMIMSDGRIDPARAYAQQQEYAGRQAPAERMAGTFAADPFGLPANIALTAIAPTAGVPAALYKAYKFLDTVDLAANVLTADAPQLAAMGLGSVALKYGPGAIVRALRTSIANTRFPTDDELAEAAARAWRESDARDYARAGQSMPATVRIVDAATGNVDTVPADVYYREVGRGAMKQARDGVTVGDKLRQWWAQETGLPAEARRFATEEAGGVRVPGAKAPEQPAAKQPWEMTLAELNRTGRIVYYADSKQYKVVPNLPGARPDEAANATEHGRQVAMALSRGDPVPPAVLADYPDLAPAPRAEAVEAEPPAPVMGPAPEAVEPSVEQAAAPSFADYDDAVAWISQKAKEYGSKGRFQASDEYGQALPQINALYEKAIGGVREKAATAMGEAGVGFGDRVWYDAVSPFMDVTTYSGTIVSRQGIPYVKLDAGQATMDGRKSARWHKGWRAGSPGAATPSAEVGQPPLPTQPAGRTVTATGTDPNRSYEFRYRVVDLDALIPSHTDALGLNPQYDSALQPRIRERAASQEQIEKLARELNPDALLTDYQTLDRGPMIVGADNMVESGNGRVLGLRRAREMHPDKYAAYKRALRDRAEQYGLSPAEIDAIKSPVLVRERVTEVDRPAFAAEANESAVLALSPYETARVDADAVSDEMVTQLMVTEGQTIDAALRTRANKPFIDRFLAGVPANERAALVDADGGLNRLGIGRIKNAMIAKTYPGDHGKRIVEAFTESLDPGIKRIEEGLFASLPQMARAEALIRMGVKDAGLSIVEDLGKAIDVYARLRKQGESVKDYLAQLTMFERELTPFQESLLEYIAGVATSPTKVRDLVRFYADEVEKTPSVGQGALLDVGQVTKGGLLENVARRIEEAGKAPSQGPDLFTLAEQARAAAPAAEEAAPAATGTVGSQLERGLVGAEALAEPPAQPPAVEAPALPAEAPVTSFTPDAEVPLPINALLAKAATKAEQKGTDLVRWTSSTTGGPEFRALELLRDMAKRGEVERVGKHLRFEAERGRLEVWNEGTMQAPVVRVEAELREPEATSVDLSPDALERLLGTPEAPARAEAPAITAAPVPVRLGSWVDYRDPATGETIPARVAQRGADSTLTLDAFGPGEAHPVTRRVENVAPDAVTPRAGAAWYESPPEAGARVAETAAEAGAATRPAPGIPVETETVAVDRPSLQEALDAGVPKAEAIETAKLAPKRPLRRAWRAGMNAGEVVFADDVQRDLFDLESKKRATMRGKNPRISAQDRRALGAIESRLIETTGQDSAALAKLAIEVHDDVRAQMKGLPDGEVRAVADRVRNLPAQAVAAESILAPDARRELEKAGIPEEGIAQLDNTAVTAKQVREVRREVERATPERVEQAIAASEPPAEGQAPLPGMGGGAGEPPKPPEQGRLRFPPPEPAGDDAERLVAALREPATSGTERWQAAKDRFVVEMYDKLAPLKGVQQESGKRVYDLARRVAGMGLAGESYVEEYVTPIFRRMGRDLPKLEQYMVAKRLERLRDLNPDAKLPGGVQDPTNALKQFRQKWGAETWRKVEEAAGELYDLNDQLVLTPARENGRLSQAAYEAIKDKWPEYIPLYRRDEDWHDTFAGMTTRQVANLSAAFSKAIQMEGSERALDEPLARWTAQIIKTQVDNARNDAARALAGALETLSEETGQELIKPTGDKAPMGFDTLSWWDAGEKQTRYIPKNLAAAAKGLDAQTSNVLTSILRGMAQPLRVGAVLTNPSFVAVNAIRDMLSAWFREGLTPISKHYIGAIASTIAKDETWREVARSGSLGAGFGETARRTTDLKAAKLVGGIKLNNLGDAVLLLPRLIMRANEIAEQTTRVAVFQKLKAEGLDDLEAMIRTRDVTVDFAKSGNAIKLINQAIPFLNAGLQGSANTVRMMRDDPRRALLRAVPLLAASALFFLWNRRFETADDIPEYEYASNWILQIGEGVENTDPRFPNDAPKRFPIYLKIPKGPMGAFLTAPAEAAMSIAFANGDRSLAEHVLGAAKTMALNVTPVEPVASSLIPSGIGTALQLQQNRDFFRGRDIVPGTETNRPPEERYGPETSSVAVAMGQATKVSPRLIDFAITDYTAGTGQTALWLLDLGLKAVGYDPQPPGVARRQEPTTAQQLSRAPVVGRFIGTRNTEQERQAYAAIDDQLDESRRLLYENAEFRRFGMGVASPGSTVTVDGVPYEIPLDMRLRILEMETPMIKEAIDALVASPEYGELSDLQRKKAIEKQRSKIHNTVREYVLAEMQGMEAQDPSVPPGVQKQYEAYKALPGYTAMMWDGRINAPRYLTITDAQAERIQQVQAEIAMIKSVAPRKITDKQAVVLYALLTNDIEGAIMSLVNVRKNPERDRYWDAHPLLDEYYDKTVPITDPSQYWQSLLPEMVRTPSATPVERTPARAWAGAAA